MKQAATTASPKLTTGACACGAVQYRLSGDLRGVIACHCEECRRTSGHFVAATAVNKRNFELVEQRGLKWFQDKPGLRRGFCNECGSSLFFEDQDGDRISIAAGSLDDDLGLKTVAHIFAAEAGHYYAVVESGVPVTMDGSHAIQLPD